MSRTFSQRLDAHYDAVTEKQIPTLVARYATTPDGTRDELLAHQIELEVRRRNALAHTLDIREPLTWSLKQGVYTSLAGVAIMAATGKAINRENLTMLGATTAIGAAIPLLRLDHRFKAGLRGGVDVAQAMVAMDRTGAVATGRGR